MWQNKSAAMRDREWSEVKGREEEEYTEKGMDRYELATC